jgi:Ca2+-binding EF-hand superfamily protein
MAQNASDRVSRLIQSGLGILFTLVLALAGCTSVQRYIGGEGPPPFRTFYSPNGEVLNGGSLGKPSCPDAMTSWFNRADTDRDGKLTREEFFADARRQFAVMDLDHDGIITPSELDRYRDPFSPPQEKRPTNRNDRSRGNQDRGRNSLTAGDTPDPVMAADIRLRNVVEMQDFLFHAEKVFASLDKKRDGALDAREAVAFCKEQEPN